MKPDGTIATKDGRIAWQIEATPSVGNVLGAPAPVIASDLAVFAFGSGDVAATFVGVVFVAGMLRSPVDAGGALQHRLLM